MDKSPDAFRTISEVAELLDTPAHVLRFWESRFPQIRPVKRAGGRRYYRPADVALIAGIRKLLHDDGMTIRGVQKILREQGVRHVAGLVQDEPDPNVTVEAQVIEITAIPRVEAEEADSAEDLPPESADQSDDAPLAPFLAQGDVGEAPVSEPAPAVSLDDLLPTTPPLREGTNELAQFVSLIHAMRGQVPSVPDAADTEDHDTFEQDPEEASGDWISEAILSDVVQTTAGPPAHEPARDLFSDVEEQDREEAPPPAAEVAEPALHADAIVAQVEEVIIAALTGEAPSEAEEWFDSGTEDDLTDAEDGANLFLDEFDAQGDDSIDDAHEGGDEAPLPREIIVSLPPLAPPPASLRLAARLRAVPRSRLAEDDAALVALHRKLADLRARIAAASAPSDR